MLKQKRYIHLGGYIGVPVIREAMLIADRVFAEAERI